MSRLGHRIGAVVLACVAAIASGHQARGAEIITHPFAGVTHIARTDTAPRPVRMHVVLVDLSTPGLRFLLTPHAGAQETLKQTTLGCLTERHAQIAINAHYFEPWPVPKPDPGTADLVGFAVSEGQVISGFEAAPPKPYAIRANAPAINFDPDNHATIVHRNPADPTGRTVAEPVRLHTALAGNEQILTGGQITAGTGQWHLAPHPLTVIGLAPSQTLVLLVVDGRQPGVSEGLNVQEAAALLRRDYAVTDALNLDGGGSSTLCMSDPTPRVVNVPVGLNKAGTLRPVGSNLAIYVPATQPATAPTTTSAATSSATRVAGVLPEPAGGSRIWLVTALVGSAVVVVGLLLMRRRHTSAH